MKIIFVTTILKDSNPGVMSKIYSQIQSLTDSGSEVVLIEYSTSLTGIFSANLKIRKELKEQTKDTVILCRYPTPLLFTTPFIFPKIRNAHLALELNSIYEKEFKVENRPFLLRLVEKALCPWIISNADMGMAVTEEIGTHYSRYISDMLVIGNGFEVASVPLKKEKTLLNRPLEMIMVANLSRWHGVERLLHGIHEMKNADCVLLHIVGSGKEEANIKNLIQELDISNNVIMHGILKGEELDNLFDRSDVAIASLGLHRTGLSEASTLKAREYCARGIPFVYGSKDDDFKKNLPFILYVDANDYAIDVQLIVDFVEKMSKGINRQMRQYAKGNLDWSVKSRLLMKFLVDYKSL